MNSRERVLMAVRRTGIPDRVPLQFDLCRSLLDNFGEKYRPSFWEVIDQQNLLPFGTPEQIEADVKAKIEVLGRGGGYMCSPAHIIQADTSMENVEAFIAAVRKQGVYR